MCAFRKNRRGHRAAIDLIYDESVAKYARGGRRFLSEALRVTNFAVANRVSREDRGVDDDSIESKKDAPREISHQTRKCDKGSPDTPRQETGRPRRLAASKLGKMISE